MQFQVNFLDLDPLVPFSLCSFSLGMVGVGGFFIMGGGILPQTFPQVLGALSVLLAFVNVTGGFVITKRMLDMFKRMSKYFKLY